MSTGRVAVVLDELTVVPAGASTAVGAAGGAMASA